MQKIMEVAQVEGRVKWFDPVKGFGFILADAGGPDILLHANVLRNFGQSSVADGARISVKVQQTQRGVQATEVIEIVPPEGEEPTPIEDVDDGEVGDIAALPMLAARVKWFDKGKGFGFANVWGRPEDVFIHAEILRRAGFADLAPGEAIAIRMIDGKRGKMAAQILSWESSLKASDDEA